MGPGACQAKKTVRAGCSIGDAAVACHRSDMPGAGPKAPKATNANKGPKGPYSFLFFILSLSDRPTIGSGAYGEKKMNRQHLRLRFFFKACIGL